MERRRSFGKRSFHRALQKLVPNVTMAVLVPIEASGRPQAVTPDGQRVDDFLIKERPDVINVLNAPAPAATASLNTGTMIAEQVEVLLQSVWALVSLSN